ncbi:carboxymuconolactone decarboxylase family protein [Mycolicibacterium sp. CBMA 234]|uniref:carboxymuconolactone decarboxylase family protein n=1 Tax=Mycolicibacterium sp. CBMA 234 TaxID=1918495 RepID=UPI001EE44EA8
MKFQHLVTELAWARAWGGGSLDRKTKSLLSLGILAASGGSKKSRWAAKLPRRPRNAQGRRRNTGMIGSPCGVRAAAASQSLWQSSTSAGVTAQCCTTTVCSAASQAS